MQQKAGNGEVFTPNNYVLQLVDVRKRFETHA